MLLPLESGIMSIMEVTTEAERAVQPTIGILGLPWSVDDPGLSLPGSDFMMFDPNQI